jgi:hypothetical protein
MKKPTSNLNTWAKPTTSAVRRARQPLTRTQQNTLKKPVATTHVVAANTKTHEKHKPTTLEQKTRT